MKRTRMLPRVGRAQLESLEPRRMLSAGQLDSTFGSAGAATVDFGDVDESAFDVQALANGKLLLFGVGSGSHLRIARLNGDGSLDTSFGQQGKIATDLLVQSRSPATVGVDPATGRFAAVYTPQGATNSVAVFDASGSLDHSFSGDGLLDPDSTDPADVQAVAFQPGGGWIVAGRHGSGGEAVLRRYSSAGALDSNFGISGEAPLISGTAVDDLVVAPDGRIVVASHYYDFNSASETISWADEINRFAAGGAQDLNFGQMGEVSIDSGYEDFSSPHSARIHDIDVSADGSISALATLNGNPTELHRYAADGTQLWSQVDTTIFNDENFPPRIAVDSMGNTLVLSVEPTFDHVRITRTLASGSPDRFYGNGEGESVVPLVGSAAMIVQGDSPILAGGTGSDLPAGGDLKAIRLQGGADALVASASLHPHGLLVAETNNTSETVSLSIRHRDNRLVLRVDGVAQSFDRSAVRRIALYTLGGDDAVSIGPGVIGAYVDAGDGNDTVTGGDGDDVLLGGAGKDRLFGNGGHDKLLGGGGNDYLLGGAGRDDLFGGRGRDTLSGAGGNDRLFGGADADVLHGGAGIDTAADGTDMRDSIETLLA
jgi:uncharacterized delta-60 repeat protein